MLNIPIVLQARNFAFLKGFLPHFAKEQLVGSLTPSLVIAILTLLQDKATEGNFLNQYGAPDYQAFASYGYLTAMHTDNDDSVTVR